MKRALQPRILTATFCAVCVASALPAARAASSYVFTTLDPTGASGTSSGTFVSQVFGLNDMGQVVVATNTGGFVYQDGVYAPLPLGPAGYTLGPEGINDAGTIVGTATDASGNYQGFILQGGSYSFFSVPGNTGEMEARAVSPGGIVSGIFTDSAGNTEGFTYDPSSGAFTDINPPGSIFTLAQGMNSAGQLVGSVIAAPTFAQKGFIYQAGSLTTFTVPGETHTAARGINDSGVMTGIVQIPAGADGSYAQTFVGNPSIGYQLLSDPNAGTAADAASSGFAGTLGEAINNSGQIGGEYIDASGNTFGFIATPVMLPVGTTASGAFTFDVPVTADGLIYIDPTLATGYQYQIGEGDPNFQSVVLPIGIGNNLFSLSLCDGTSLGSLAGGTTYDFGSGGTSCFDVSGIPISAGLDPTNPGAFPTGLTFDGTGTFTGTMTPMVTTVAGTPEPGTLALFAAGLLGMALAAKRQRS